MKSSSAPGVVSPVTTISAAAGGTAGLKPTSVWPNAGVAVAARAHEARRVNRNSTVRSSSLRLADASSVGGMRVCLVVVALILGVLAAPAAAQTEPLPPGTTVVPRDGQVWTASSWPDATPFEMQELVVYASGYEDLPDAYAFAVATSPATTPDG